MSVSRVPAPASFSLSVDSCPVRTGHCNTCDSWASLVAWLVKNPPAVQETWVRSLGWEDPLEKGKATHSSRLAWRIPWTRVRGVAKSQTGLIGFHFHFHGLTKAGFHRLCLLLFPACPAQCLAHCQSVIKSIMEREKKEGNEWIFQVLAFFPLLQVSSLT